MSDKLAWSAALHAARHFNLFVETSYSARDADAEGRLAIGGDLNLYKYGIGRKAGHACAVAILMGEAYFWESSPEPYQYVLIDFPPHKLHIVNSDVVVHPLSKFPAQAIDFRKEVAALTKTSDDLAADGDLVGGDGTVLLKGAKKDENKFKLSCNTLERCRKLVIEVPAASRVLVSVVPEKDKDTTEFTGSTHFSCQPGELLFNFNRVRKAIIHNIAVGGSILAPTTHVTVYSGQMTGVMVAKTLDDDKNGHFQFNWSEYWPSCDARLSRLEM